MGPVVVVGAGPIGMTAALALAHQGLPSTVLEAAPGISGEGSKAICVQRDVLDILDRLGVGRAMADEGISWTLGRTYFRNRELFQTRLPTGASAFPPFVNLPQCRSEELLLDRVRASDLIDLRWEHRVDDLTQDPDGVTLTCTTPLGRVAVRAPWVIGCDGARSAVRKLLRLDFPGHSHPDRFLIADIRADLPFPNERRFFFDPPFNPGRTVLIHPQPDRVWRLDWQVPADTDIEQEHRSGRLDERVRAIVGDALYELVWLSSYRFHQRVVPSFRAGRVLLAGDAAHLMSPFGARGMNSGIQDAENAAWKLALVLHGDAPEGLLDSYDVERRAAALENLRVTDATMRFMAPSTRARRAVRNAILRGSALPALRRLVNSGRLAEPFDYADSPVVLHPSPGREGNGPQPGRLAPDAPCRVVGSAAVGRLRQLVGPGFLVLAFLPGAAAAREFLAAAARHAPRVATRVAVVPPPGMAGLLAASARDDVLVVDDEGGLAEQYAAAGWYLLRPDGHVGAGPLELEDQRIAAVVEHCTGSAVARGSVAS